MHKDASKYIYTEHLFLFFIQNVVRMSGLFLQKQDFKVELVTTRVGILNPYKF